MIDEIKKTRGKLFVEWYSSDYSLILLAVFAVLFWALGWDIAGAIFFVLPACVYMWFASDLKPVIAVIMLITLTFSLKQIKTTAFMIVVGLLVPILIISFIYNLIKFRNRNYRKGKLFFAMLLAYIVTLLSGITYDGYDKIWTLAICGVGLGVYFVYFLCVNCIKGDLRELICKLLFIAGLIAAAQSLIWFFRQPDLVTGILSKKLRVGWGMSNTIAVFFVMAVPAVAWLGTRHKAYSYIMFPSIGFFTVMLMLTLSRGNILFGLPIICVSFVYGFIKTRVKGARIIAVAILAACVVLFFALPICDKIIYKLFDGYKQGFFDPHGRIEIYKRAWKNFRESPIFGVGYIKPKDVVFTVDGPSLSFLWKTHNTFLQILSCSCARPSPPC